MIAKAASLVFRETAPSRFTEAASLCITEATPSTSAETTASCLAEAAAWLIIVFAVRIFVAHVHARCWLVGFVVLE